MTVAPRKPLVHVVEDELDVLRLILLVLERAGWSVEGFSSGPAYLERIASGPRPDLVLLDVMMPGMDGWEVCRRLRAREDLREVPVVFLTARTQDRDYRLAREAGGDLFLEKPFDVDRLPGVLEPMLEARRPRRVSSPPLQRPAEPGQEGPSRRLLTSIRALLALILTAAGLESLGSAGGGVAALAAALLHAATVGVGAFLPRRWYAGKVLCVAFYMVDVAAVMVVFHLSGGGDRDLFLVFFFTLFVSALARHLGVTLLAAAAACGAYALMQYQSTGFPFGAGTLDLLRFPLFFAGAAFTGYLAEYSRRQEEEHGYLRTLTQELSRQADTATRKLLESNRRLNALLEYHRRILSCIEIGVLVAHKDGMVRTFNAEASRITRLPAEEVLDRPLSALPKGLDEIRRLMERTLRDGGHYRLERAVFEDGHGGRLEATVETSPLRAAEGFVLGAIATLKDRTPLQQVEAKLAQSERLSALGRMAAGIAHEIRNPLNVIQGFSLRIVDKAGDDNLRKYAELIQEEVRRLDVLLSDVLEYGRAAEPRRSPEDLNALLEDTLRFLADKLERGKVEVRRSLDPALPAVPLDADRIRQVFLNLFLNAVHAMPRGGTLTVVTEGGKGFLARERLRGTDSEAFREEPLVRVRVRDTGMGIPKEHLSRIFEPFYTTKRSGTGLGLSICAKIVEAHGGVLEVTSEPEKGTEFQVLLPLSMKPAET